MVTVAFPKKTALALVLLAFSSALPAETAFLSPQTRIATPSGNRAISSLAAGEMILSLKEGALQPVKIAKVVAVPVPECHAIEIVLSNGSVLNGSAVESIADGRLLGELVAGDKVNGVRVLSARSVKYRHTMGYEILPESSVTDYMAGGISIRSSLASSSLEAGLTKFFRIQRMSAGER